MYNLYSSKKFYNEMIEIVRKLGLLHALLMQPWQCEHKRRANKSQSSRNKNVSMLKLYVMHLLQSLQSYCGGAV